LGSRAAPASAAVMAGRSASSCCRHPGEQPGSGSWATGQGESPSRELWPGRWRQRIEHERFDPVQPQDRPRPLPAGRRYRRWPHCATISRALRASPSNVPGGLASGLSSATDPTAQDRRRWAVSSPPRSATGTRRGHPLAAPL